MTQIQETITPIKNVTYEKDELTEKIISCCFKLHTAVGPGFPERIYHNGLLILFKKVKLNFDCEKELNVLLDGEKIGTFRCDLIIENKVIVEIKSVSGEIPKLFEFQLLSYLKASGMKTGLLINFGNKSCQVKRFIN